MKPLNSSHLSSQSCTCQRLQGRIRVNQNLKRSWGSERSDFTVHTTLILVDVSEPSLMWNIMLTVDKVKSGHRKYELPRTVIHPFRQRALQTMLYVLKSLIEKEEILLLKCNNRAVIDFALMTVIQQTIKT